MSRLRWLPRVLLLAAVYCAAARLALLAAVVDGNAAPLWPPTGIALVAVLIGGRRMWPSIFLGELAVELTCGVPAVVSLIASSGNVLEVLAGAALFTRLGGRLSMRTLRDIVALGLGAGVVASTISATAGVGALVGHGTLAPGEAWGTWQTWWLGNLAGVLIVTPAVLAFRRISLRVGLRPFVEAAGLTASTGIVAVWALSADHGQPYIVFPLLALAGMRFGPGAAAVGNLVVAGICVWCAARGFGPFVDSGGSGLRHSQEFLLTMALTSLLLGVTSSEVRAHRRRLAQLLEEQAAIADVATLTAAGRPVVEVLERITQELLELLDLEHAVVVVPHGIAKVKILVRATRSDVTQRPPGTILDLVPGGAVAMALELGAPWTQDERGVAAPTMDGVLQRFAVPIRVDGRIWGALVVASEDGRHVIGAGHERALGAMAEIAAVAIGAAEAREQLVVRASTDPLTGLSDHGALQQALRREFELSVRHGHPVGLVLLDLDGFKQVNDVIGHAEGDDVLRRTARCLERHLRQTDLLARLGGDELAVLLPHTDGEGTAQLASRMRAALADAELSGYAHVTASFGISVSTGAASVEALLRQADAALLESKALGGNTVTPYRPHLSAESEHAKRVRLDRTRTLTAVRAMARAIDARDSTTTRHSERVADLAAQLATECGWTPDDVARLRQAGLVHDVGKLGVRDAVLFKPGPLDAAERAEIERHAALGSDIVSEVLDDDQVAWVRGHHERFDGGGYPDGLAGEQLSRGAALLALADAWDAMTSARPYSTPRTVPEALAECRANAGTQFAPWTVEALGRLYALVATA